MLTDRRDIAAVRRYRQAETAREGRGEFDRKPPAGQVLGYGGDCTTTDTEAHLATLRLEHTPRVCRLVATVADLDIHDAHVPELVSSTNRLRRAVDVLNERLDEGKIGGTGEGQPSGLPLPAMSVARTNYENCAGCALAMISVGGLDRAHLRIVATLEDVNRRGTESA